MGEVKIRDGELSMTNRDSEPVHQEQISDLGGSVNVAHGRIFVLEPQVVSDDTGLQAHFGLAAK